MNKEKTPIESKAKEEADRVIKRKFKCTRFIIQPIKLGDFIPCDLDGNVLEKPMNHDKWLRNDKREEGLIIQSTNNSKKPNQEFYLRGLKFRDLKDSKR